jgi:hypothetical protein
VSLFAHHTQSWLGLDIEVNDQPFPGGMLDHVLVFVAMALMLYGAFALIRDLVRWQLRRRARATTGAVRAG